MSRLFGSGSRTDATPKQHAESRYAFMERVDSLFFENVREVLEDWYNAFPDEDGHLRSRLCSDDDRGHVAAFWELYLHAAYLASGLEVEVHPDLGTEARSVPDFLVHGSTRFVVEARMLMTRAESQSTDSRISPLYDAVNDLTSDRFFVWASVLTLGEQSPSLSKFKRKIEEWLNTLDADAATEAFAESSSLDSLPTAAWEDRGWLVELRAIPKKKSARGKPGRLLGMTGAIEASWIDDHTPLVKTLKAKAPGQYGDFDHPYVIAILSESPTVDEVDVASALFGRDAVQFQELSDGSFDTTQTRQADGFWHGPLGFMNTRVSGVLVALTLLPWTIATSTPRLWLNPYTGSPLPDEDHAPWATAVPDLQKGEMIKHLGPYPLHELFGLPSDWPGELDVMRI